MFRNRPVFRALADPHSAEINVMPQLALRQSRKITSIQNLKPAPGLVLGSLISTVHGKLPVEFLATGDKILTHDSGPVALENIRIHKISAPLVQIKGGSLGHKEENYDTILPASQEILLTDWRAKHIYKRDAAIVPVGELLDGEFVLDIGVRELNVMELVFASSHVIESHGLKLYIHKV